MRIRADFRVGHGELAGFAYGKGPEVVMRSVYQDIAPDERIVFCYRMAIGDWKISSRKSRVRPVAAPSCADSQNRDGPAMT